MIPRGSIDDFGGALEGPPPLKCWECPTEFRYFHEALEHEETTDHAVCEPKERLAEHSYGCGVCVDQQALHERRNQPRPGVRRARVTWRR
jgi:hypothetical protein